MTKDFFGKQMDRLRNVYSEKSLSEERVEVLWATFKNTPNDNFEAALNFLIGEFTTQALPSVSRIHEAVQAFKKKNPLPPRDYSEHDPGYVCPPCRDFGYGWVGEVITRCVCTKGQSISDSEVAKQQANYDAGAKFLPLIKKTIKDLNDKNRVI